MTRFFFLFLLLLLWENVIGFCPPVSIVPKTRTTTTTSVAPPLALVMDSSLLEMTTTTTSTWLSFADQGQNLAGIFFQASLLPYLAFLYFLSFRANRTPAIGNFGFQFVLLFVLGTIPSGIISKATYASSLADVDWLHGGAEALLTIANVLIVLGFKNAGSDKGLDVGRVVALGSGLLFAVACAFGPQLGFEGHSAFAFGLGNLSPDATLSLPFVSHSEPMNALSIPTWTIHFSSVLEFLVAMQLVWNFATVSQNERWKGLTWGMLPLHASGICACTYHFFYNQLPFLVTMQAAFTCLGNITCALAAYRIAQSNGWTFGELNPFPRSNTSPQGLTADAIASLPILAAEQQESNAILGAKIVALTIVLSYVVKYGELGLDLPFTPNAPVALGMVLGLPALTAFNFYNQGSESLISMEDVKTFGVAGTVAYVLTELAFWAVAFPVASYTLYQTSGHWPDVINDGTDRATVLGFIFAGANVARLLVPLRLGAALALAPWVDQNIIKKEA